MVKFWNKKMDLTIDWIVKKIKNLYWIPLQIVYYD